jgi:GAF domain-containing protein
VFQDLLARQKLYCQLGTLAGARQDRTARALACLEAILQSHPGVDRAVVYLAPAEGGPLVAIAARQRDGSQPDATALAPIAQDALAQASGLLLTSASEREALSARLALVPPNGAIAALPIRHAGELAGVLYLDSLDDSDALRRSDREHLLGVAGIVGCLLAIP